MAMGLLLLKLAKHAKFASLAKTQLVRPATPA